MDSCVLTAWGALMVGAFLGMVLSALLVMSRRQAEEEGDPTIVIQPVQDDDHMESITSVDMQRFWERHS